MVSVPIGSIVEWVSTVIPDIPSTLSGTNMNPLIERKIHFAENYTGETIGTTAIADKWQQIITDFGCASVLNSMELLGADVSQVRLGEFSVSKGGQSNTSVSRDFYESQALEGLKLIGRKSYFKKTFN